MGSAQSSMLGPEALTAGAIVAGAAVTAIALDNGWFSRTGKKGDGDASKPTDAASSKKGAKKSKEDKELDKILAEAVKERKLMEAALLSASAARVVGVPDVVPGSFDAVAVDAPETKKKKKRKGAAAKKAGESAASSVLITSPENSILQVPPAVVPAVVANEGTAPSKKSKKRKAANTAATAQAQTSSSQPSSSVTAPAPSSGTPKTKSKGNASGGGNDSDVWTHVGLKKRSSAKRNASTTPLANSMTDVSPSGTSASASVSLAGDEPTTETSAADTGAGTTDKASADEDEEEEETGATTTAPLTGVEEWVSFIT